MTTYKIKTTHKVIWLLTLLLIVFGGAFLAIKILPRGFMLSILSAVLIVLFAFFIAKLTATAIVEIELINSEISIRWLTQYILHNERNKTIQFNKIKSYKYQPDKNFDLLRLTFMDGSKINLWHFTFTYHDDFQKLVNDFPSLVEKYNKQEKETSSINDIKKAAIPIEREKTIYESRSALPIVISALIAIIAALYLFFFKPIDDLGNASLILTTISGAVFSLIQFYKYRKKGN